MIFIKKDKSKSEKIKIVINKLINEMSSKECDPNGSYTGRPIERNEIPTQDADDL